MRSANWRSHLREVSEYVAERLGITGVQNQEVMNKCECNFKKTENLSQLYSSVVKGKWY